MGSDNFLKVIGLKSGADISVAGTQFTECIKEYISFVENSPSEDNIAKEEAELTALYRGFFPYSIQWAQTERQNYEDKENHDQAFRLKEKGQAAIKELQDNIIEFSICYMRIHRTMGLINVEIKNAPETDDKDVQWTNDTGVLLAKYRKQRKDLIAANETLVKCRALLEQINPQRAAVEKNAAELYGQDQAEKMLSGYRSGLRTGDFDKARRTLSKVEKEKKKFAFDKKKAGQKEEEMQKSGQAYIAFLEEHQDILKGDDGKFFMKASETDILKEANDKEIVQKEAFIKKYYRPYLNYKIKTLKHLRQKLLVVGSLESLMTLYIRLMRGIAEPLVDIKQVRLYESEVIEHIMYLLTGQFQETKNIEKRVQTVLKEFKLAVEDYGTVAG